MSISNGYRGLRTRRIDNPDGSNEDQIVFQSFRRLGVVALGKGAVGDREGPQCVVGQFGDIGRDALPDLVGQIDHFHAHPGPSAPTEQDIWSSLSDQDQSVGLIMILFDRGHQLAL